MRICAFLFCVASLTTSSGCSGSEGHHRGRDDDAGTANDAGPDGDAGDARDAGDAGDLPDDDAVASIDAAFEHVTERGFEVRATIAGDADGDATATLAYCNETLEPGCDPDAGTIVDLARADATSFTAIVWNLWADQADDTLSLSVRAADPDGIPDAPYATTLVIAERRQVFQGSWRVDCHGVPGTAYTGISVYTFLGHSCHLDEMHYASYDDCDNRPGWATEEEIHFDCSYREHDGADGIYDIDVYRDADTTPRETWTFALEPSVLIGVDSVGFGGVGVERPGMPLRSLDATPLGPTQFDATLSYFEAYAAIETTSATLYYCNQTDDPGCDPRDAEGVAFAPANPIFTASVDDPALSLDLGDELFVLADVVHTPDLYEPYTLRYVHVVE